MCCQILSGQYSLIQAFRDDCELMCRNALVFNPAGSDIWKEACRIFDNCQAWMDEKFPSPMSSPGTHGRSTATLLLISNPGRRTRQELPQAENEASLDGTGATDGDENLELAAHMRLQRMVQHLEEPLMLAEAEMTQSSYLPHAFALTEETAATLSWIDVCVMCGSGKCCSDSTSENVALMGGMDPATDMLFCCDCGEAFHIFCLHLARPVPFRLGLGWRCPNCKLCEACGIVGATEDQTLLLCDGCDRSFHMKCVTPAFEPTLNELKKPKKWFCSGCVSCSVCGKSPVIPPPSPPPGPSSHDGILCLSLSPFF